VHNEDKTVTPKERFASHSEWTDHIEKDHLHPLGMEKGDGPSTSHIGKPQLRPFDLKQSLIIRKTKPVIPLLELSLTQDPRVSRLIEPSICRISTVDP
jgi:hypothetical protein